MLDLSKINTDPTKIDPSKPTVTGENLQNLLRAEANVGKVGGAVTNEGKIVGGDYGGEGAITSDILAPSKSLDLSTPSKAMNDAGALAMARASGVIGATEAKITNKQDEINKMIESQLRGASSQQGQVVSEIRNILGGIDTANEERMAALQSPEFLGRQKSSNDAYNALLQSKVAQANEIDAINKSNMSDVGRNAALREVTNKYALQNANLSVVYDVANRDYQSALNNINTIAQLKIESVQPKLNFYQSLLPFYNSQFTKAEQNIIESKKDELKSIQEGAKEVSEIYAELLKNNPGAITPSLAQGLSNQPNKVSALEYLAKNQVSLAKPSVADVSSDKSVYSSALANASLGLPENQRKENMARLNNYLTQGDTKSAKELIIRTAFAGQTGTQKEDTIKRQNALDALGTIKGALSEYVAKSGDTNIVKGNIQSLKQKLGTSGDPELAAIGTKITLALQQYRNAVTGAAWGQQETDEYKQIFPSYKNTDKLNGAIIDAMRESMAAYQESTLSAYIGSNTYKQIFSEVEDNPFQQSLGGSVYNPATGTFTIPTP